MSCVSRVKMDEIVALKEIGEAFAAFSNGRRIVEKFLIYIDQNWSKV